MHRVTSGAVSCGVNSNKMTGYGRYEQHVGQPQWRHHRHSKTSSKVSRRHTGTAAVAATLASTAAAALAAVLAASGAPQQHQPQPQYWQPPPQQHWQQHWQPQQHRQPQHRCWLEQEHCQEHRQEYLQSQWHWHQGQQHWQEPEEEVQPTQPLPNFGEDSQVDEVPTPVQDHHDSEPMRKSKECARRTLMHGAKGRRYTRALPEDSCRRCGMDQEEHTRLDRGKLNKHHVIAVRDGGHMTDPDNLYTLCYFCHKEWHTWWEALGHDCSAYMAAQPACEGVMHVPMREGFVISRDASACHRCGCRAKECQELRPGRKPFHPFEQREHGKHDHKTHVCYWCQREWEIFWRTLRPDVGQFFHAQPFRP